MLPIQTGSSNPILRAESEKISMLNQNLIALIEQMKETVKTQKGLGLAAPQVGKNIRLFVLNITPKQMKEFDGTVSEKETPAVFMNPEIIEVSEEQVIIEEGCLSLPDIFGNVKRPQRISMHYQDENFQPQTSKFDGLVARVIQHETDHLNGILFIDKL